MPMPTIRFTQNIQRHVPCPAREVDGSTVGAVLAAYFEQNERARGYVLDERGRLRHHMAAFVNGQQVLDRDRLSDPVAPGATVDIFQALSGG